MNKDIIKEKLENLKIQQKQLENTYTKIQGAIELCEALLQEEESKVNGKIKPEKEKVEVK